MSAELCEEVTFELTHLTSEQLDALELRAPAGWKIDRLELTDPAGLDPARPVGFVRIPVSGLPIKGLVEWMLAVLSKPTA